MDTQTKKLFDEIHRKLDQILGFIVVPEQMKVLQGQHPALDKMIELDHTLGLILESFKGTDVPHIS